MLPFFTLFPLLLHSYFLGVIFPSPSPRMALCPLAQWALHYIIHPRQCKNLRKPAVSDSLTTVRQRVIFFSCCGSIIRITEWWSFSSKCHKRISRMLLCHITTVKVTFEDLWKGSLVHVINTYNTLICMVFNEMRSIYSHITVAPQHGASHDLGVPGWATFLGSDNRQVLLMSRLHS